METPNAPKKKKSTSTKRAYQGADAVMLTAALVILDTAAEAEIQPLLQARRSKQTPQSLSDLRKEIAAAISDDLGLNPTTIIQQLTQSVYSAQEQAQRALSEFNLDLKDAFIGSTTPARLPELRALLGLRDHYAPASRGDQQALTELLAKFILATDAPTLRAELQADLDISPSLIDRIRAHANFADLDAAQELSKGKARTITDATIRKFNDLYARVMAVARLGRSAHQKQPTTADRFSFSAVRRKMTGGTPSA
ncbi:MAG: hypothetical protein H7330_02815 [Hymenobacteraceae bacterium]|nr:hypothetical protein [Hymenobacteraceae bacterium]